MVRKNIDCLIVGDSFFDVTVLLPCKRKWIAEGGTANSKCMFLSPGGMGNAAVTVSKLGGKSAFCGMDGRFVSPRLKEKWGFTHYFYRRQKFNWHIAVMCFMYQGLFV